MPSFDWKNCKCPTPYPKESIIVCPHLSFWGWKRCMCPVIYTIAYRRSRKAPDGLNLPPEIISKIMQCASKPARRHYGNSNKEQLLKYEQDYCTAMVFTMSDRCWGSGTADVPIWQGPVEGSESWNRLIKSVPIKREASLEPRLDVGYETSAPISQGFHSSVITIPIPRFTTPQISPTSQQSRFLYKLLQDLSQRYEFIKVTFNGIASAWLFMLNDSGGTVGTWWTPRDIWQILMKKNQGLQTLQFGNYNAIGRAHLGMFDYWPLWDPRWFELVFRMKNVHFFHFDCPQIILDLMLAIAASPDSCRLTSISYHALNPEVNNIDVFLSRISALPQSIENLLFVIRAPRDLHITPNSAMARKVERSILESPRFRYNSNLYLFIMASGASHNNDQTAVVPMVNGWNMVPYSPPELSWVQSVLPTEGDWRALASVRLQKYRNQTHPLGKSSYFTFSGYWQ